MMATDCAACLRAQTVQWAKAQKYNWSGLSQQRTFGDKVKRTLLQVRCSAAHVRSPRLLCSSWLHPPCGSMPRPHPVQQRLCFRRSGLQAARVTAP